MKLLGILLFATFVFAAEWQWPLPVAPPGHSAASMS